MQKRGRYPLAPLIELREQQVDQRIRLVRDRAREAELRARQWHDAQIRQREHLEQIEQRLHEEQFRASACEQQAVHMQHLHAWHEVQREEQKQLQNSSNMAHHQAREAARHMQREQENLAHARAQVTVIEKHRDRFVQRLYLEQEQHAESECEDVFNARWSKVEE